MTNSNIFAGKTLLITGGTGTFGNVVVDMARTHGFGEIRIFSRDEKKQDDMRSRLGNAAIKFYLGDVRNYDSILQAMHGVDFVFHVAALKQVPSCEFFPILDVDGMIQLLLQLQCVQDALAGKEMLA